MACVQTRMSFLYLRSYPVAMKIAIRRYTESDTQQLLEAVLESVEHLSRWMSWCTAAYSIGDAQAWASSAAQAWSDGTEYRFVVEDIDSGRFLGAVGINQVVSQHKIGNLGYWVRRTALNRGVCTTAASQAIRFAFQNLDFRRLEIHILTDNHASNAVAAKLGATYEGTLRNKIILNGTSLPAKCYAIFPDDYILGDNER
jgi:RimJ/RimL family protein N-acetyltransferase